LAVLTTAASVVGRALEEFPLPGGHFFLSVNVLIYYLLYHI